MLNMKGLDPKKIRKKEKILEDLVQERSELKTNREKADYLTIDLEKLLNCEEIKPEDKKLIQKVINDIKKLFTDLREKYDLRDENKNEFSL
jgi:hypothetical protein